MTELQTPIQAGSGPASLLALTGRLIDGTGAQPLEHGRVVLHDGRLVAVGRAEQVPVPEQAEHLQVQDGTILPGLIDLHVHARPHYLMWFPAAGVTTVRDAGNALDTLTALAHIKGRPQVFAAGPVLDGPRTIFRHFGPEAVREPGGTNGRTASAFIVNTPEQAREAVDELAEAGVSTIKLYEQLALEVFTAAVERARLRQLPVMADLGVQFTRGLSGAEVDALQAIERGVGTIEHASGYALAYRRLGGDLLAEKLDDRLLDQLARATLAADVTVVPTFMVFGYLASEETPDLHGVPLGDLHGEVRAGLDQQWTYLHRASGAARDVVRRDLRFNRALMERVQAMGGRVAAGTDTPAGAYNLPGGGLHEELEHLTHTGLTPVAAIHAATGAAARVLGRQDLGTLTVGSVADVLVVRGNPALDICATRQLEYIVQAGQLAPARVYRERARQEGAAQAPQE